MRVILLQESLPFGKSEKFNELSVYTINTYLLDSVASPHVKFGTSSN